MHVRCPHCHNPIEVVDPTRPTDFSCPSCGSNFSLISGETAPYAPGAVRTIGHFELLGSVGGGRFGTVWKARDTKLDRTVAVKIPLRGRIEDPEAEMFVREARAAAQIKHLGVVSVHEVGREEGTLYIVSDFIDGCSLKQWLSGRRLYVASAADQKTVDEPTEKVEFSVQRTLHVFQGLDGQQRYCGVRSRTGEKTAWVSNKTQSEFEGAASKRNLLDVNISPALLLTLEERCKQQLVMADTALKSQPGDPNARLTRASANAALRKRVLARSISWLPKALRARISDLDPAGPGKCGTLFPRADPGRHR